jgi:hypothetical protein
VGVRQPSVCRKQAVLENPDTSGLACINPSIEINSHLRLHVQGNHRIRE